MLVTSASNRCIPRLGDDVGGLGLRRMRSPGEYRMAAVEGERAGADASRSQGQGMPAVRGALVGPVEVLAAVPTFFVPVCCYDWAEVLKSALGARGRSGYASFTQWIGGLGGFHSRRARNRRGGVSELASRRSLGRAVHWRQQGAAPSIPLLVWRCPLFTGPARCPQLALPGGASADVSPVTLTIEIAWPHRDRSLRSAKKRPPGDGGRGSRRGKPRRRGVVSTTRDPDFSVPKSAAPFHRVER